MKTDHPYTDPGDGRSECMKCGKWIWPVTHSCKRVPVTEAAKKRWKAMARNRFKEATARAVQPDPDDLY